MMLLTTLLIDETTHYRLRAVGRLEDVSPSHYRQLLGTLATSAQV